MKSVFYKILFIVCFAESGLILIEGFDDRWLPKVMLYSLGVALILLVVLIYRSIIGKTIIFLVNIAVLAGASLIYIFALLVVQGESVYSNTPDWLLSQSVLANAEEAIDEYANKNCQCPSSLEALAVSPYEFLDRFNGTNRLKYMANSSKCTVYSIGPDRVDNYGGKTVQSDAMKYDRFSSLLSYGVFSFLYKSMFNDEYLKGDMVRTIQVPSECIH